LHLYKTLSVPRPSVYSHPKALLGLLALTCFLTHGICCASLADCIPCGPNDSRRNRRPQRAQRESANGQEEPARDELLRQAQVRRSRGLPGPQERPAGFLQALRRAPQSPSRGAAPASLSRVRFLPGLTDGLQPPARAASPRRGHQRRVSLQTLPGFGAEWGAGGGRQSRDGHRCFQEATVHIFRKDYSLELAEDAFAWIPCNYGPDGKFSLHLVVSSHSPQFVYRSNLASPVDPQGAGHLARRLGQVLPVRHSELIDQSVYTRNRGIRLPYSSKPATPLCRLIPLDESKPLAASCITWFEENVQTIVVHSSTPDVVVANRPRSRPEHFRYQSPEGATTYAVQRCMELIQTLHPTAYRRGSNNSLNYSWHDI
jgi:hypothetical protein